MIEKETDGGGGESEARRGGIRVEEEKKYGVRCMISTYTYLQSLNQPHIPPLPAPAINSPTRQRSTQRLLNTFMLDLPLSAAVWKRDASSRVAG